MLFTLTSKILKCMYIVTSRDYSGSNMTIWYFKSLEKAEFNYKELKRYKYKRVNISKVIK